MAAPPNPTGLPAALPRPRASRILEPGLQACQPGGRVQVVPGRGLLLLPLRAGDRLELIDAEGGQHLELGWVAGDRADRPQALLDDHPTNAGRAAPVPALGLLARLGEHDEEAARQRAALARHGIDPHALRVLACSGPDCPAGPCLHGHAPQDGLLLLAVPGEPLDPGDERQATATPAWLRVTPADSRGPALPEPLGQVEAELRIAAGTAQAYRVRAGQHLQVIDVEGRQCSDFQAFSLRKLAQGGHGGIDATLTRTLLGRAMPLPGLPSRAFDADGDALVELVQDSCGRHDAFATACSARYYDDLGYPGHVNCSDNFNAALAPHGVPPRRAWEALNFFFNTAVDAQERLTLDEPWSRPGDQVLLRALDDLLCVSSACPDDIDAANGWQPTDIHVRIYSSQERFPRAVATRMTPDAPARYTRETPFHPRTSALARHLVDYRGHWLASHYDDSGVIEEYWACREAVVVADLSALRKFEITGPDAEALLQWTLTRDVRRLAVGQVVYTAICHPHGGMLDDGTLLRLGEHNFRLVCGEDLTGLWLREQAAALGYRAWVRSSTEQMVNLAVQGPRSRELLAGLVWTAPSRPEITRLGWFRFTPARLGGAQGAPLVVSRTGYTGELGYEIFCHPRDALALWDAVMQIGAPLGLRPMGLDALDRLRIEAGLIAAGHEFDDRTDPFEAGIGFTVPLRTKEVDFVGREALLARQSQPRQVLVGLELDGAEVAAHGDAVFIGRERVGLVTSGCLSPLLQRSIALARVEPGVAVLGTAIEIGRLDGHQKRLPGRVVRFPHHDPDKTRVRA
ncbi:DUF1989 domain-containing protein (plasmid) [Sphaerotilus natans]|uniref:DUF1989 domain-containing protein n=1 Tax=Sphaerotilus natans TaxID=34103 RepID=UPI00406C2E95